MEKRPDQMDEEELRRAESAALASIGTAAFQISKDLMLIDTIHTERFHRQMRKPRRRKKAQ